MADTAPIKLLLIHDQVDEANRLISLLRNAGYQVSSKQVESEQDLPKLLQNAKWDLIFAQHNGKNVNVTALFHNLRRLHRDIPVITITEDRDTSVVESLRMGATDAICVDEDQHLLLAVSRALYDFDQRRRLRFWKRRYAEAETRCNELLDSSKDAIAIVKEGTYIYTNDSYAHLFGYLQADDMDCLPVIDSVNAESQPKIKPLLKALFSDELWESRDISFTGLSADELPVAINMHVSQVEYEDEPALQFLIKHEQQYQPSLPSVETSSTAPANGDITEIRLHRLIDIINGAIRRAAQKHKDSLLMMIQLDSFDTLAADNGIQQTEELVREVAKLVEANTSDEHTLGRYQRDSFLMLLPNTDADDGLRQAEALCNQISNAVIEINDQTFPVTLSIGLSVISEAVTSVESAIGHCAEAIDQVLAESTNRGIGNGAQLLELNMSPTAINGDTDIEAAARQLLDNQQFEIRYQPIISLQGDSKPFYEVLVNLKSDVDSEEFPDDFITQVFKSETARDIDHWAIHEAIHHLVETHQDAPDTTICLNISRSTFCDPNFISWLTNTLKSTVISPKSLLFQLREIDVGSYLKQAQLTAEKLQEMNCKLALTHFGLAIDPTQLLSRMSVHFIKLDRMLVNKAQETEEGLEALEKMLNTLRNHNENIIVPYLESPAMMPTLWKLGVQYIQGHYLQSPQATMSYNFSDDQ